MYLNRLIIVGFSNNTRIFALELAIIPVEQAARSILELHVHVFANSASLAYCGSGATNVDPSAKDTAEASNLDFICERARFRNFTLSSINVLN